MKKHVWEYLFKDEKELKKHQERLNSFNQQTDYAALGCFYIFMIIVLLVLGILLIMALFNV